MGGRQIDFFIAAYRDRNPKGTYFDKESLKTKGIRLSEITISVNTVRINGRECYRLSIKPGGRGKPRRDVFFDCETMQETAGEPEPKRKTETELFIDAYNKACPDATLFDVSNAWRMKLLSYTVTVEGTVCHVVRYMRDGGTVYWYFSVETLERLAVLDSATAAEPLREIVKLEPGQRIELSGYHLKNYNGRFRVIRKEGTGYIIQKENKTGKLARIGERANIRILDELKNYKRSIFYNEEEAKRLKEQLRYYPDERRWPYLPLEGEPIRSRKIYEMDSKNARIEILQKHS